VTASATAEENEASPCLRMRLIGLLMLYLAIVFPGGALLAPWFYRGAHESSISVLSRISFPRSLDRSLLGLAIIGLWPLLRLCGLRSWRELGFVRQGAGARQILGGFVLGWASLALVALLAMVCGAAALVATHSSAEIFHHLASATWASVIVAVIEELIFRGALFGVLRKAMPWPLALLVSSAVYSAVHFIQKADFAGTVQWDSGLILLWTMFSHPPPLIPAALTLLAVGAILALCYQRTGALYVSIGLHAGWIFWLKSYGFLLRVKGPSSFWGTDKLIDGWLSFLILSGLLLFIGLRKPAISSLAKE
jgi:membrane protease YdiL (CAAX protease family)